jgi:predicted neutral ceramidase superfamily lipid hydrolase
MNKSGSELKVMWYLHVWYMAQYNSSVEVSIRYYTEVALTKLVEVKIIVTSDNHLINPFRKNNPFHANILNEIVHNG